MEVGCPRLRKMASRRWGLPAQLWQCSQAQEHCLRPRGTTDGARKHNRDACAKRGRLERVHWVYWHCQQCRGPCLWISHKAFRRQLQMRAYFPLHVKNDHILLKSAQVPAKMYIFYIHSVRPKSDRKKHKEVSHKEVSQTTEKCYNCATIQGLCILDHGNELRIGIRDTIDQKSDTSSFMSANAKN